MQRIILGLSLVAALSLLPLGVSSDMDEVNCCILEQS
jgi:hypothetical protein